MAKKKKSKFSKRRRSSKQSDKKKIFVKDWLEFKPYDRHTNYDIFYTKVANDIFEVLDVFKDFESKARKGLDTETRKFMAINLTQYFEDFISEIGIWKTFQKVNKELYNYALPFYNLDEYIEDDLNPEDVQFLIWYYMSELFNTTYLPDAILFRLASLRIYTIFDECADDAPATAYYDDFYELDENADFRKINKILSHFVSFGYLLCISSTEYTKRELIKVNEDTEDLSIDMLAFIGLLVQESAIYTHYYPLNGMSGIQWVAELVECSEETRHKILGLSKTAMKEFVYKGKEVDELIFEHWHTGRHFNMKKDTLNRKQANSFKEGDLTIMTLVQWNDQWYLPTVMSPMGNVSDNKKPKKEAIMYSFHSNKEATQKAIYESVDEMETAFRDVFGSNIYRVNSKAEYEAALRQYYNRRIEIGNESGTLSISDEQKNHEIEQQLKKDLNKLEVVHNHSLMIFTPKIGHFLIEYLGEIIDLLLKPDELSFSEKGEIYDYLFFNSPIEVMEYVLKHFPTKNYIFPVKSAISAELDVVKYWKFLHRYHNSEDYEFLPPHIKSPDELS